MKAKKLIFLVTFVLPSILHAVVVRHTLTCVTEQRVLGHLFKHVMVSGSCDKDQFSVDGVAVGRNEYEEKLEHAVKKEHEDRLARQEALTRSRLEFMDVMQLEIAGKLVYNVIGDVTNAMERIENPALAKFFVFNSNTVDSSEQLIQLKNFFAQLQQIVQYKIQERDIDGLHVLYTQLELWPIRLEKFFQDTVQNAIKKSDDTAMLKELLKLVSELS